MDKKTIIEGIKEFKNKLSKEKNIKQIIFFGSRAKGEHKKYSDIDLIIVSPEFHGIKTGRSIGLHKHWKLNYPVDFICYTPEEFNKLKKQVSLVSEALKEGITIA